MKKKIFLLALAAITVSILAAGTAAYQDVRGRADNVITTGAIAVDLLEWADEAKTMSYHKAYPSNSVDGVIPGQTVTKMVEVKNTGNNDAYVRVKVAKSISGAGGASDQSLVRLDFNLGEGAAKWTERDGFYYYNEKLEPQTTTAPLFTKVGFAAAIDNRYKGGAAAVDVTAYATQADNNGDKAWEAVWPQE